MILTTCPACAAPLAHDAPRCVRCKMRYCDSTCQHDHWRRGSRVDGELTCADIGLEDGDQLEAENVQDAVAARDE